jgi:hypothetical protein
VHESLLAAWESFYVIVGSSAAALTGLQFVVIVLASDVGALGGAPTTKAFGTPTIVHFCAVLLISAVLSAPWHDVSGPALVLAISASVGLMYTLTVIKHARRQTGYVPVLEDWIWHVTLPLVAYASLFIAAIVLRRHSTTALFAIGGDALLLLFIGIHNAWDAVTYIALRGEEKKE